MASTTKVSNRDYEATSTAGDVIYFTSNNDLNINARYNNMISCHLELCLRVCSGRVGLLRLLQFTLNYMGFCYNFYDYYTHFYEVNNVYIHDLITGLKVIILDLIVLLNADIFKYHVFYFLILKLIFGRI